MHISIVAKRKAFMKIFITEIACLKYSPEWEKLTFLCQYVTEENWNNNEILSFSVCFLEKVYETVWRSQFKVAIIFNFTHYRWIAHAWYCTRTLFCLVYEREARHSYLFGDLSVKTLLSCSSATWLYCW